MLPAQYHVWLAIFTPLIADKFLVRTKDYIRISGTYVICLYILNYKKSSKNVNQVIALQQTFHKQHCNNSILAQAEHVVVVFTASLAGLELARMFGQ